MGNVSSHHQEINVRDENVSDPSPVVSGITDSGRSWISSYSHGSFTGEVEQDRSAVKFSAHGNFLRAHRKRDPMRYYQVIHILGEGSMGSVAKVRKRDRAKGGSARKKFVQEEHRGDCCYHFQALVNIPSLKSKFESLRTSSEDQVGSLHVSSSNDGSKNRTSKNSNHHKNMDSSYHSLTSWNEWVDKKKRAPPEHRRELVRSTSSSSLITYGTRKETYFALKSIHLDRCTSKEYIRELKNEVNILKELDHPNIVKAYETFDYHDRLFIVLELCSGGDLYTRDPYTEADAAKIVHSLLSAVAYLHDHQIVHRDLKFENIMFSDKTVDADIKVIDFGLSQKFARNEHLRDAVGTVYTMSPELLRGDYTAKIDVWSAGVICFMLLSSSMPFYGRDRAHVIRKIISGHYSFASRRWKQVSADAKAFAAELLQLDPDKRPSAEQALQAPWLDVEPSEGNEYNNDLMDNVQANIQAFAEYSRLKRLALMVIAYKSTDEEIGILKRMFGRFDRRQHGEITLEEFKETLSGYYAYSDEELDRMFRSIDVDGTGKIHYTEFLAATLESSGAIDEERIAEAFDRIDTDCTGYITVSDLQEFLGSNIPTAYLDAIIDECDITRDHRISYEEFLDLWNKDTDLQLEEAKISVHHKRLDSRQSSFVSSVSSLGEYTDSEPDLVALAASKKDKPPSGGPFVCGTLSFQNRKRELSLRGSQVL